MWLNRCTWLPCFADNCFLCVLLGKDEEVDEDESVVKVPCPPPAVAVEEAAVEDVAAAETAAKRAFNQRPEGTVVTDQPTTAPASNHQ